MLESRCRKELSIVAAAYGAATGRSLSAVSAKIYGNSWYFEAFIDGKPPRAPTMTIRKFDQIMEKFRREWPAGTPWPNTGNVVGE